MTRFLISAATLVVFTTGASADIICTPTGGCWETHKKIYRHGGVYRGLEHTIPSKADPSIMVKRRLPVAADFPARSPQDRR
jgi:hypothetical protein